MRPLCALYAPTMRPRCALDAPSVPASWSANCYFGTICVYCGEHHSLTHHFKHTFSSIFKQAKSTQTRSQRKQKLSCVSRRVRAHVENIRSGQVACQMPFWHYLGIPRETPQLDPSFQTYSFLEFLSKPNPPNLLFFARTHVCLVSARSDGPDHADSLSTPYVSRVKKFARRLQQRYVHLDPGFLSPEHAAVRCRHTLWANMKVKNSNNISL